jgi:hypothetical protein
MMGLIHRAIKKGKRYTMIMTVAMLMAQAQRLSVEGSMTVITELLPTPQAVAGKTTVECLGELL